MIFVDKFVNFGFEIFFFYPIINTFLFWIIKFLLLLTCLHINLWSIFLIDIITRVSLYALLFLRNCHIRVICKIYYYLNKNIIWWFIINFKMNWFFQLKLFNFFLILIPLCLFFGHPLILNLWVSEYSKFMIIGLLLYSHFTQTNGKDELFYCYPIMLKVQ